jgi:hypothetical protein
VEDDQRHKQASRKASGRGGCMVGLENMIADMCFFFNNIMQILVNVYLNIHFFSFFIYSMFHLFHLCCSIWDEDCNQ